MVVAGSGDLQVVVFGNEVNIPAFVVVEEAVVAVVAYYEL